MMKQTEINNCVSLLLADNLNSLKTGLTIMTGLSYQDNYFIIKDFVLQVFIKGYKLLESIGLWDLHLSHSQPIGNEGNYYGDGSIYLAVPIIAVDYQVPCLFFEDLWFLGDSFSDDLNPTELQFLEHYKPGQAFYYYNSMVVKKFASSTLNYINTYEA